MSRVRSELIVELLDRVTEPARKVGRALAGITEGVGDANGRVASVGERLNDAMARNDRALARARGGLVDAAAGAYILQRALSAPINAAANFEESMINVGVISRANEDQLASMTQQAKELGRTTMFTASEVADGMGFLAMAGFDVDQVMGSMENTLNLAAAGGMELGRSADIVSNILSGYGKDVKDLDKVSDILVGTFTRSNTSLSQLGAAFTYAGPIAAAAGMDFAETAAVLGRLGDSGYQGTLGGTALRGALVRLLAPTKGARAAMDALDVSAGDLLEDGESLDDVMAGAAKAMQEIGLQVTDAEGKMRPFADIMQQLEGHADNVELMAQLFGQRAGPAMAALLKQGSDSVRDLADELNSLDGEAARVAEARMDGFAGKMRAFRSAVEGLQIAIGDALLPALTAMAETFTRILGPVTELAEAYPRVTGAIVAATAGVIGFKIAIAGLRFLGLLGKGGVLSLIALGYNTIGRAAIGAKVAATNMIGLQTALAGMAGRPLGALARLRAGMTGMALAVPGVAKAGIALKLLGGVLKKLAWPITAVAVGALLIRRYWDRLSAVFRGVGSAIREALDPAIEWLAGAMGRLRETIRDGVGRIAEALGVDAEAAKAAFDRMLDFSGAIERVRERFANLRTQISEIFGNLFAREILSDEESASIEARAKEMTHNLMQGILSIPEKLGALYDKIHAAGVELVQSLLDGALEQWEVFIAWVRRIPEMIREAIGRIDLRNIISWPERPSWLGGTGGSANPAAGPGGTPGRAKGGPISRGGTYLVGEKGPELISASRNGYVHTADATAKMGGVSVHDIINNINITVSSPNASPREIADQVATEIERRIRESLRGVMADTGIRIA